MHQAFQKAGGRLHAFAGDIWVVPDRLLTFADPDPSMRTRHDTRYALVLQGDDVASNHRCPTILVALMTSNITSKQVWEDRLETAENGLSRPSLVKLHLLQPIPRMILLREGQYVHNLPPASLQRIQAHLIANLGIVVAPSQ